MHLANFWQLSHIFCQPKQSVLPAYNFTIVRAIYLSHFSATNKQTINQHNTARFVLLLYCILRFRVTIFFVLKPGCNNVKVNWTNKLSLFMRHTVHDRFLETVMVKKKLRAGSLEDHLYGLFPLFNLITPIRRGDIARL